MVCGPYGHHSGRRSAQHRVRRPVAVHRGVEGADLYHGHAGDGLRWPGRATGSAPATAALGLAVWLQASEVESLLPAEAAVGEQLVAGWKDPVEDAVVAVAFNVPGDQLGPGLLVLVPGHGVGLAASGNQTECMDDDDVVEVVARVLTPQRRQPHRPLLARTQGSVDELSPPHRSSGQLLEAHLNRIGRRRPLGPSGVDAALPVYRDLRSIEGRHRHLRRGDGLTCCGRGAGAGGDQVEQRLRVVLGTAAEPTRGTGPGLTGARHAATVGADRDRTGRRSRLSPGASAPYCPAEWTRTSAVARRP